MAKKNDPVYQCSECGKQSNIKVGICPNTQCHAVDAYELVVDEPVSKVANPRNERISGFQPHVATHINDVSTSASDAYMTGVEEFDMVTGGIIKGSIGVLGGNPGAGKTTLLLTLCLIMSNQFPVLYVSHEENEGQVKKKAKTAGIDAGELYLVYENDVRRIIDVHIPKVKPKLIVIDSINHMIDPSISSGPDSPTQMKACTSLLQQVAKSTDVSILMIAQVNAKGEIAGRKDVEHMVDMVMYMETDTSHFYRLLRCIKHRFHDINNVGVFAFNYEGMLEQVHEPSAEFLADRSDDLTGSAIAALTEGNRPMLVEVVALTRATGGGYGMRNVIGYDRNRAIQLSAVLEKTGFVTLAEYDLWISVVGGVKITQTSTDLAVACAIVSTWRDMRMPADTIAIGEIVLNGKIKRTGLESKLLQEAAKMGITRAIVPPLKGVRPPKGMTLIEIDRLEVALRTIFRIDEMGLDYELGEDAVV